MTRALPLLLLALACLLVGGLFGTFASRTQPAAPVSVTCRPSHPPQALAGTTQPVVLFWGNSLLFDHGWDSSGFAPVNCARQGMTLAAARQAIAALPQMQVDAILLAFGSVELIRPGPVDTDAWEQDMAGLLRDLRQRYPQARILAASIPAGVRADRPWSYGQRPELARMNTALLGLLGSDILDLSAVLDTARLTAQHYDGVHLSRDAYHLWEDHLAQRLGGDE